VNLTGIESKNCTVLVHSFCVRGAPGCRLFGERCRRPKPELFQSQIYRGWCVAAAAVLSTCREERKGLDMAFEEELKSAITCLYIWGIVR